MKKNPDHPIDKGVFRVYSSGVGSKKRNHEQGGETMQTINWTTGDGREIELTVTAEYGLNLQGRRKTSGRKSVEIVATVDGEEVEEVFSPGDLQEINHPVAVAKIGDIGLSRENYDRVQAAIVAVESEIAEHNAACDRHARSLDAIDDSGRSIAKAMRRGE